VNARVAIVLAVAVVGLVPSARAGQPAARPRELVFVSNRAMKLVRPVAYSVSERGGRRRAMTGPFGLVESIVWAPIGNRFALIANGRLRVARPGSPGRVLAPSLRANDLVWSPDGRHIAFLAGYDLFVVPSRGGRPRLLVRGVSSRPAWSPSGDSMAFTRELYRDGDEFGELWLLDVATGRKNRLLGPWSHAKFPSWSPDGRRIAFEYSVGADDFHRIYTVDVESRRWRRIAARGFRPSWSPDGWLIAATTSTAVYVLSADGSRRSRVFERPRGNERVLSTAWAPDGRRLAVAADEVYVVRARGRPGARRLTRVRPRFELADDDVSWSSTGRVAYVARPYERGDNDVYLATRAGKRLRPLTANLVDERQPVWSPDGSELAYVEYRAQGPVIVVSRGQRRSSVARGENPAWSPDGTMLTFDRGGDLFVVSRDGSGEEAALTGPRLDADPSWSPDGAQLVFERAREVGRYPVELWAVKLDGSGPRQITDVRRGRGPCEVTSASDPDWAPDGAEIAFALLEASSSDCVVARGGRSVYAVKADGSAVQRLIVHGPAEDHQDEAYSPSWSSDGRQIVFVSDTDRRGTRIAIAQADGAGFRLVSEKRAASYDPDWRPVR
jgi:Tol biopolymer transport system component